MFLFSFSFADYAKNHPYTPVPNTHSMFKEGLIAGLTIMVRFICLSSSQSFAQTILQGVILVASFSWLFRRRYYISYWILRRRRRLKAKEKQDGEKENIFDMFVSYSPVDSSWVETKLLPEMEEKQPRLRVCARERDFQVSERNDLQSMTSWKSCMCTIQPFHVGCSLLNLKNENSSQGRRYND